MNEIVTVLAAIEEQLRIANLISLAKSGLDPDHPMVDGPMVAAINTLTDVKWFEQSEGREQFPSYSLKEEFCRTLGVANG